MEMLVLLEAQGCPFSQQQHQQQQQQQQFSMAT
jgi:hypothetical protein